jgi:hypothetical protein
LIGYSDADWIGCKINRKSTSGTCQFLGRFLVSWASKKQNSVALSTAEAEYIAAGHCCAQLLWMRQTLRDYGYTLTKVPLLCDNESAIRMADNPIKHSRTKHIAIRYHFLMDHIGVLKGNWSLRRRQRLPLHSIELLILRRRSEQLSNFGIIFTHILFAKGGESSYEKGFIFHSSIRFWRFMPKGEKVLAQSKRTAPPPIFKI